MTNRIAVSLCVVCTLLGGLGLLRADEPAADTAPPKAPAGGKACEGTLTIGGKTYKLTSAAAYEVKVFDDMSVAVVLSDKAIPVDKLKAALKEGKGTDDKFNLWQSNIKVNFDKEGKPMFTNAWADNNSVSVSGTRLTGKLAIENGTARGEVKLEIDADSKRPSGFDARFAVPLIANPLAKSAAKLAVAEADDDDADEDAPTKPGKPAKPAATINVHDLPMPKDASAIEYKKLVEMMNYASATEHKSLAAFLSKELKAQGWASKGSDLVAAKSAILHRTKGSASLTIFVKPADKGSTVSIHSEGLLWDDK